MITLGADPEVFLRDTRTGQVTPACGLFGGSKQEPLPLEGLPFGYAVQEDNVMLEFNIPVCEGPRSFTRSIQRGKDAIADLVRTRYPHLAVDYTCQRLFTGEQLGHEGARTFGCAPDFNAYDEGRPWPEIGPELLMDGDMGWRFAGGHVHIGYEAPEPIPPEVVARLCDVLLGLRSLNHDKQGKRREFYGQAGRFRPTPYGIEYRTLSNFWVFEPDMTLEIGRMAGSVGDMIERYPEQLRTMYREIPWTDVAEAINTEDVRAASSLLSYCYNDLRLGEYV